VAVLPEVVLRVGTLAEDLPEVAELDLNPVLVRANGALTTDARVGVEPRDPAPPEGARPRSPDD